MLDLMLFAEYLYTAQNLTIHRNSGLIWQMHTCCREINPKRLMICEHYCISLLSFYWILLCLCSEDLSVPSRLAFILSKANDIHYPCFILLSVSAGKK